MSEPTTTAWDEGMRLLRELPTLPLESREAVIEQLMRNPSPGIRERALRVGAAVLREEALVAYLRSDSDAVLRNAALEILKEREGNSFRLATDLLRDEDDDVVLQAVLILDHIKDPRAVESLRSVLHQTDPNVVQAAIVAVGHLGDARAISDLLPFLDSEPWLQLAAVQALGDLRSPQAIGALEPHLTDLMVGPFAAEAIAQIGGPKAFAALASYWLAFYEKLDPETALGLLAHTLEGLTAVPDEPDGLRISLASRLRDPFQGVRVSAARCLLALGAGAEDGEALSLLAGDHCDPEVLPSCLARRDDLIETLLAKPGITRSWGFLLATRFPAAVDPAAIAAIAAALRDPRRPDALAPVVRVLSAVSRPEIHQATIDFYLSSPIEERAALAPVFESRRDELGAVVSTRDDINGADRLVLEAVLGGEPGQVVKGILAQSPEERLRTVSQLTGRNEILRRLPWEEWLQERTEGWGEVVCKAAVDSGLRELLPTLRRLLAEHRDADYVRALGALEDRESVPAFLALLEDETAPKLLEPVVIESLGRIGGPEARKALRDLASSDNEVTARLAYKALARCAAHEDDAFFRDAVAHPDWYVRLAAVEVLGRFVCPENLDALSRLAADPVALVARRGLTAIREEGAAA